MTKLRDTYAAAIGGIIADAAPDAPINHLRKLIREAGPKKVTSCEFRIWHEEGRRATKALAKARRVEGGGGLFG